ncbi:helix-turn-helix domain-containing protein [Devosia sp. Root635]|uniref:helix-turn-helix domain-containing protein n=1 Tax=Devosia sp. Root635 TaxID=1736575 RepID=UPI0006F3F7CB|nr:helix-turn-helix transcriptional regulator [Devosia sp. Root635]KRA44672.1 hypothetical protein ASD80_05895 [Devosia sp. Root635]
MNLTAWRKSQGKSLAETAAAIGIVGANPARSLQRYESGERVMPAVQQAAVETFTNGAVTFNDMFAARLAWETTNLAEAQS